MKLITEVNFDTVSTGEELVEGTNNKRMYIEGIFLQGAIKNKNGRIYPSEVLEKEVARYTKDLIDEGRAYGELGHPDGPAINLPLSSHIITSLRKEGNDYVGKAVILPEGNGKIVRGILEMGGKLGVSSRGLGTVKENRDGVMEVQSDYTIATAADIVADPSAPKAFVRGIMEGVDFFKSPDGSWKVQEAVEDLTKEMKKMTGRQLAEKRLSLFERYLGLLAR